MSEDSNHALKPSKSTLASLSAGLVLIHVLLCYPAMISRGNPPLPIFWTTWSLYLCYGILPLFSVFMGDNRTLRLIRRIFLIPCSLATSIAATNISGPRPHVGHVAGVTGLIRYQGETILLNAILLYAITNVVVAILQKGIGWLVLQTHCRSNINAVDRPWYQFTLGEAFVMVLISGFYLAIGIAIVGEYPLTIKEDAIR